MKLIKKTIREALKTPGFSLLYIVGVAFTIAFTMIYGMLLYAQLAPVYPEYDRDQTVYINTVLLKNDRSSSSSGLSSAFIDEFLSDSIPAIEQITTALNWNGGYPMVQPEGNGPEFHVECRHVDPSFFKFYKFEFLAGKPVTQADFDSNISKVVISDKVARRLFGDVEEAVGKDISIDHVKHRIHGVFREGSALCLDSYGEVFFPALIGTDYNQEWPRQYMGPLKAIIKVKPGKETELREYLRDVCRRINAVDTTAPKLYLPTVMSHSEHVLAEPKIDWSKDETLQIRKVATFLDLWKPFLIALLVLLIIPALNISGLIGARMDRMKSEIGIRRCFGAKRPRLMNMVITENLILTLIGGVVGLISAWLIATFAGTFLLELTPLAYKTGSEFGTSASFLTGEMAFAPLLFALTLGVCLVLNIISAWIPAWNAMRRQIIESLNTKR
ncbi:MAG: ABC transporter permease [Muribaculaceae bacterium]|nr:ABC transporter permease [Muribaculaceae bacterium]